MNATAVAIGSAVSAAIIAIVVPWMTFRLALRQDHRTWLREQPSSLYVAMLTEAYAEIQYIQHALAPPESRELAAELFKASDVRLPPMERAQLGARGSILGSQGINQLFNEILALGSRATLLPGHDGSDLGARMKLDGLWDKLQAAVRDELGADRIRL